MNAIDVLENGHQTVMQAIEGLEAERWEDSGVVGVWSTKDVIAHLAWYGDAYDLDDFIAYMYYGHKREHAAQIKLFRAAADRPTA